MKAMNHLKHLSLGKLKMWQIRFATYISMINFLMIFYLFIVENEWFKWYVWIVIIFVTATVTVIVDTVKVMPEQLEYGFVKNPAWQKSKRNQKRIMDKLGIGESYE